MPLRPQLVMDCFLVCFCAEEILFLARAFSRLSFYDFCFKTLILASYASIYRILCSADLMMIVSGWSECSGTIRMRATVAAVAARHPAARVRPESETRLAGADTLQAPVPDPREALQDSEDPHSTVQSMFFFCLADMFLCHYTNVSMLIRQAGVDERL